MPSETSAPETQDPIPDLRSSLLEGQDDFLSAEETSPPEPQRQPVNDPPAPPADDSTPAVLPTAETPPVVEPATEETPAESVLTEILKQAGFAELGTDEENMGRLGEYFQQQASQRSEMDQLRSQLTYYQGQLADFQQRQPEQQPPAPAPGPAKAPGAPEQEFRILPQTNLDHINKFRGEDGSWNAGTPPEIIQQGEEWLDAYHQWQTNPDPILAQRDERLLGRVREMVKEEVGSGMSSHVEQAQTERFIEQYTEDNPWIYAKDPVTNEVIRGQWSKEGERLREIAADLWDEGEGVPFEKAWGHALTIYNAERANLQTQANPAAAAADAATNAKKKFLQNNNNQSNQEPPADRGGTLPLPGSADPQPPQDQANRGKGRAIVDRLKESGEDWWS